MEKEGGQVNKPPVMDGSNYDYWKVRMVAFLNVRFLDICWLHFIKTLVIARCQTRCLNMLVRHHNMPWTTSWRFTFNHEDFRIIYTDLYHGKSWPRERGSRRRGRRLVLNLILKNVVATFKETSDLLQICCAGISRFQLILSQELHITPILHSCYINKDRRPKNSLKPQL